MDENIPFERAFNNAGFRDSTEAEKNESAGSTSELAKTAETLFEPGDVVELRMFKKILGQTRPKIRSGFFDDFGKLIEEAKKHDAKGFEIYVTLNRLKPELLDRCPNKVRDARAGEGTSDGDVLTRRWVFIDADPERKSGISSTDEEKAEAWEKIQAVRASLKALGWGGGILADSGNGYHLLYPVDLPNDQASLALVGGVLEALSSEFTGGGVKIDRTTKNAARIDKLYGVTAKKGENTPERPHRKSRILEVPEDLTPVSKQQLTDLAALKPEARTFNTREGESPKSIAWVERFIEKHDIPIGKNGPWNGTGYVWEPDMPCPWNEHYGDTAFWIGVKPTGEIVGGCHHDSCGDYDWHDVREHFEPGHKERKAGFEGKGGYALTDIGNAERFAAIHGGDVRWVEAWHKFVVWNGRKWEIDMRRDVSKRAQRTAKGIHKDAAADGVNIDQQQEIARHAISSQKKERIGAMVELAKPHMIATPEDFDADPWLLNCQNGIVDLRTGKLLEHNRDALMAKATPAEYDPNAEAPHFHAFLNQILPDEDVRTFLQTLFGSALVGEVKENILPILYGTGSNGKSTLMDAVMEAFGEYAIAGAPDLIMSKGNSHPTELADLFGARLVSCMESEEGRRLNEGLVKQLTGRDKIKARRMHEEFWEFGPTHTVFLGTNHKPEIRGTDHAIWRRLKLVPFVVTIPDAEQDKDLPAKLQKELPGVLRWLVEGCLKWQRGGLREPDAVKVATNAYRADMDVLAQFIDEECVAYPQAKAPATELYRIYTNWCQDHGEKELTQKKFGQRLAERGFESFSYTSGGYKGRKGWRGIGRKATEHPAPPRALYALLNAWASRPAYR
jgi:P4 family phage/plasmid primase-like protien